MIKLKFLTAFAWLVLAIINLAAGEPLVGFLLAALSFQQFEIISLLVAEELEKDK